MTRPAWCWAWRYSSGDPGATLPRNAFSEWFWIEDGKIRNIWTAMYYPGPERPVPNWPPFDGNFPLPVFTTSRRRPPTAAASYATDLAAIAAFNMKYLKAINDGDINALSALTDDDHIAITTGKCAAGGQGGQYRRQWPDHTSSSRSTSTGRRWRR